MAEEEMSESEIAEKLSELVGSSSIPDAKDNIHTFLRKVVESADTTKTAFLTIEEIGTLPLTVRAYKELALISSKIMNNEFFQDYFEKEAEIVNATSLSRDAKLLGLAVISKKEIADVTSQPAKENRGWFKRKTAPQRND